ncbi:MAG: hypothetical protein WDM92_00365 [Caulobacteraceae bacterium]
MAASRAPGDNRASRPGVRAKPRRRGWRRRRRAPKTPAPVDGARRARGLERVEIEGLSVAPELFAFIQDEALPGSGVDSAAFWAGASALLQDLAPENRRLLKVRDEIAGEHRRLARGPQRPRATPAAYRAFPDGDRLPPAGGAGLQDTARAASTRRFSNHRRAAAGRAAQQRPLRPERRQLPAGAASTTPSTAPTRSPRRARPCAGATTIPSAARG